MMREGIAQVTTKIDPGFRGVLNWSLRNGSTKDLILQFGEPIYKLTLFLLAGDEKPDTAYGNRKRDGYQDSAGIARSRRRISVDIPSKDMIGSSIVKLDPKKRLREAGFPFDHIGSELADLQGKWEFISEDVKAVKGEFEKLDKALTAKIEQETKSLLAKINEVSTDLLHRVDILISQRQVKAIAVLVAIGSLSVGAYKLLLASQPNSTQAAALFVFSLLTILFIWLYSRISKR